MNRIVGATAALALLVAGCSLRGPIEPTVPLEGDAPRSVLVLPAGGDDRLLDARHSLAVAAADQLAALGYAVIPIEVGAALLEKLGHSRDQPLPAGEIPGVGRALGVEACLQVAVRKWDAFWASTLESLDYDVRYRLFDVETGALIWERPSRGQWSWTGSLFGPVIDERDAFETSQPFSPYKTNLDAARAMARQVFASLPDR